MEKTADFTVEQTPKQLPLDVEGFQNVSSGLVTFWFGPIEGRGGVVGTFEKVGNWDLGQEVWVQASKPTLITLFKEV